MSERFRLTLKKHRDGAWEGTVFDLIDHGPDTPYAGITAGSLAQVLDQAAHYILVAEADQEETMELRRAAAFTSQRSPETDQRKGPA